MIDSRNRLPELFFKSKKLVASASMFARSIIDQGKQRFFTGLLLFLLEL
ncbi:hypothetical protein B4113_1538 [Geobacillus sp. B4113_201601]|nr:hypothetical protein B4113_1538 [Geobacillus sp. B4113_201601]